MSVGARMVCTAEALAVEKNVVAIYAWDGVMTGLRGNRKIGNRIIAGTFYIVKVKNGRLCSLTDKEIVKYILRFQHMEEYSDEMVMDSWVDETIYTT